MYTIYYQQQKKLVKDVIILSKLILVMAATNSTSEHSFSVMRSYTFYNAARKIKLPDAHSRL